MSGGERAKVAMTAVEVAEFLAVGHTLALATIGPDGWSHVTAMWYAMVNDAVVFMTHRGSQKHRNLLRDNRIVGLVEDGHEYAELRGVQFRARATEICDEEQRLTLAGAVTRKYRQGVAADLAQRIAKRAVYRAEIVSTASWDHRKLGG
ncbi:pyridoxamine 5'-phosphate oxidase family protein [Mycolicibacterium sp. XJ1819]